MDTLPALKRASVASWQAARLEVLLPRASQLRLGTEQRQPPTGSADWYVDKTTGFLRAMHRARNRVTFGRMSSVGPDGVRGMYPSGVGHAVPVGTEQALCGRTNLHLWNGDFDPSSRVVTPCPECTTLALTD